MNIFQALEYEIEYLQAVIQSGAPLNDLGPNGNTALQEAAINGWANSFHELILANADIHVKNIMGQSLLEVMGEMPMLGMTTEWGLIESVRVLISLGADVNHRAHDATLDWTPLHIAASNNQGECALLLIAAGAKINAQNIIGFTPIHFAAGNDDSVLIQIFCDAGADLTIQTNAGFLAEDLSTDEEIIKVIRDCRLAKESRTLFHAATSSIRSVKSKRL